MGGYMSILASLQILISLMLALQEANMVLSLWVSLHKWLHRHCTIPHSFYLKGNELLLRYDKHWEALIEHYDEKKCLLREGEKFCKSVTNFARRSPYFREAEEQAQVPFLYHHLLECDYNALEYTIDDHDITLRIPMGAVAKGEKIHIEVGVTMYGPFTFPEKTQPISPIVWLCIQENIKLKKPFQLILPHFLTGLSKETLQHHQIKFSKANHKHLLENDQIIYKFQSCDTKPLLATSGNKSYGIIRSTHCCFYCIQASKTPELARDAGYCLARVENSQLSYQRNEVYFTAVYFLGTCIKVGPLL